MRVGRKTYLSVGPHGRPPRTYRGYDCAWWLGVLGKWDAQVQELQTSNHVTVAVSGARGGETIDFRRLAAQGMVLVGMTESFKNGKLSFAEDLANNLDRGDQTYLSLLDEADAFVVLNGLNLPQEPEARILGPTADCITNPILELDLTAAGITTIIWATGFRSDYSWLKVRAFDDAGRLDIIEASLLREASTSSVFPDFPGAPPVSSGASGMMPSTWPITSPFKITTWRICRRPDLILRSCPAARIVVWMY